MWITIVREESGWDKWIYLKYQDRLLIIEVADNSMIVMLNNMSNIPLDDNTVVVAAVAAAAAADVVAANSCSRLDCSVMCRKKSKINVLKSLTSLINHMAKSVIVENNRLTIGEQYIAIQNFYNPVLTEFRLMWHPSFSKRFYQYFDSTIFHNIHIYTT